MRGRLGHRIAILAGALLALVACASSPTPTRAHARLAASTPADGSALAAMPAEIKLDFTEPVVSGSTQVSLSSTVAAPMAPSADGVMVEGTAVRVLLAGGSGEPQTVTLAWRVVSAADGHETTGLLIFSVGTGLPPPADESNGDGAPRWTSVALRTAGLLGLALQAAALASGRLGGGSMGRVALAWAGAVLGLVGFGGDVVERDLLGRQAGCLLLLAAGLTPLVAVAVRGRRPWPAVVPWLAAVTAAVAAGHAAGDPDRVLSTAVGTVHAALGLGWAGAVATVALSARRGNVAAALRRLGPVALLGVVGLAAAGVGLTALRVDGVQGLTEETYGRLVLAKQALLATAVAAAAVNRLVLLPRLPVPGWAAIARPVLAFEALILAGALGVAGALSTSPPANGPRAVAVATRAIPVEETITAGELTVAVTAALLGAEDDELLLRVTGPDGEPVMGIQRLIVATSVTRPGDAYPTPVARLDAEPLRDRVGLFALPAANLGVAGEWGLEMAVRRAGVEDAVGRVSIDTTGWVFEPPRLVEDAWRWPTVPLGALALALAASVVLAVGFAGVRRSGTIEPLPAVIILGAVVAITAGFAIQAIQQIAPATAGHDDRPPAAAPDILAAAERYRTYCLACHGADGGGVDDTDPLHDHGSGTDLLDAESRRLSDGDLFSLTSAGVPGTTMPAHAVALTEKERWDLIAYLRQLQRDRPPPADGRAE